MNMEENKTAPISRISKQNYYLDIAQTVSERSTCLRRRFGAIIVKNDVIVSTGYNGAPRGRKNCSDLAFCRREQMKIPRGERYELCRSVHAEANAIIAAPREQMLGAALYICCTHPNTGEILPDTNSCMMCKRQVINAGIKTVIIRDTKETFRVIDVNDWVENDDSLGVLIGCVCTPNVYHLISEPRAKIRYVIFVAGVVCMRCKCRCTKRSKR